jgi:hypothetical protein
VKTINVDGLRKEREQLRKRIQQIDALLDAVAAFDGGQRTGRPGRPPGTKKKLSPEALERIRQGQKKRRAKERAAKKAKTA